MDAATAANENRVRNLDVITLCRLGPLGSASKFAGFLVKFVRSHGANHRDNAECHSNTSVISSIEPTLEPRHSAIVA